jgi:hypothetical protein
VRTSPVTEWPGGGEEPPQPVGHGDLISRSFRRTREHPGHQVRTGRARNQVAVRFVWSKSTLHLFLRNHCPGPHLQEPRVRLLEVA